MEKHLRLQHDAEICIDDTKVDVCNGYVLPECCTQCLWKGVNKLAVQAHEQRVHPVVVEAYSTKAVQDQPLDLASLPLVQITAPPSMMTQALPVIAEVPLLSVSGAEEVPNASTGDECVPVWEAMDTEGPAVPEFTVPNPYIPTFGPVSTAAISTPPSDLVISLPPLPQ